MKKTQKRVLGFLGLSLVVAITCVAAVIPSPGTAATSTITDVIKVRVVGSTPNVDINNIENEKIYTDPARYFTVDHENVETLSVNLRYTDVNGDVHYANIDEIAPDYEADTQEYNMVFVRQRGRE